METNKLTEGDWVNKVSASGIQAPVQVTWDELTAMHDPAERGRYTWHPIPLTDDILAANGFEYRPDLQWTHRVDDNPQHYDFKISGKSMIGDKYRYTLTCGIYYLFISEVHIFQHVLRLCGLDELADNLKLD